MSASQSPTEPVTELVPPYASPESGASFVDRLVDATRRLPYGGWWLFPVLLVLIGGWVTIVSWVTRVAPVGHVDLPTLAYFPYPVFALALIRYLDDVASRAFDSFAPALGGDEASIRAWRRRLTTLPARPTAVAAVSGLALALASLAGIPPEFYRGIAPDLLSTVVLVSWVVLPGYVLAGVLLYQTWRQLSAVSEIHAAATRIDPFQPEPLFSFAGLTARTGLGYLAIIYYSVVSIGRYIGEPIVLVLNGLFGAAALACFLVPLMGMHGRLVDTKRALRAEAESRIARVTGDLYGRIDRNELVAMSEIDDTMNSLQRVRDAIERLPTWPWSPQLLRGFLTALLLPVAIWLITRILGQLLGA